MYDDIEFIEVFVNRIKSYKGFLLSVSEQKRVIESLGIIYKFINDKQQNNYNVSLYKIRYDILCIIKGMLNEDDDIIPEVYNYFDKATRTNSKEEILNLIEKEITKYKSKEKEAKQIKEKIIQYKSNNLCITKKDYENCILSQNLLKKLNEDYGFEGFVHTTSFNNFISIMKDETLYCRELLERNNKQFCDIALQDVIEQTIPSVSKYVRFYWRTRTPTNYTNEGIKPHKVLNGNFAAHSPIPVILIFKPEAFFLNENVYYTDKNAGTHNFGLIHNIEALDFNNIFDNTPIENLSASEWNKIKKARCSEILYPFKISIEHISKIIFRSECDKERAIDILGYNSLFSVDSKCFNNNFLYVKSYELSKQHSNFVLNIRYNLGNYIKYKYDLDDYKHSINYYKNNKIMYSIELNEQIGNKTCNIQNFNLPNIIDFDYFIYYIDGIECFVFDPDRKQQNTDKNISVMYSNIRNDDD